MIGFPPEQMWPRWAIWLRAVALTYVGLMAADWVLYATTGEWVPWPIVFAFAVAWPLLMMAII